MKTVAITGISGYIGSKLLAQLDKVGEVEKIIGLDIKPPKVSSGKLKFYPQNVLEPFEHIFRENQVDSAIHLAFVLKPTHNRAGAWQIDIKGSRNFLEACSQAQVKHILYLSSHTVYGAHPENTAPLKEDSPLRPVPGFQYSWDKAEVEKLFQGFASSREDVCLTILRVCPVIGPNAGKSVVTSMFRPLMLFVAGYDPPLQFVHEDDLVRVILTFLRRRIGGIFNVAGEGEIRYSEVARLCRSKTISLPGKLLHFLMSFSWKLHLQNESPPEGLEFIKYPPLVDTQKLKSEAGFRFNYSSKDAVASFVDSYLTKKKRNCL